MALGYAPLQQPGTSRPPPGVRVDFRSPHHKCSKLQPRRNRSGSCFSESREVGVNRGVADGSDQEVVPPWVQQDRVFRSTAGPDRAAGGVAEVVIDGQIGWKATFVYQCVAQPLVEQVIKIDGLPTVLHGKGPGVRAFEERFEASPDSTSWVGLARGGVDGEQNTQQRAFSASCLYGIVHSVVVALGCAPGLGFVHTSHDRSFVYDVADLYKAEIVVTAAFDVVAAGFSDPTRDVRRLVRDAVVKPRLLERAAKGVGTLLQGPDAEVLG